MRVDPDTSPLPERLLWAVLEDGIRVMLFGDRRRSVFHDTRRWIFATDDDSPFAFHVVCAALRLDPARLRAGLAGVVTARESLATRDPEA